VAVAAREIRAFAAPESMTRGMNPTGSYNRAAMQAVVAHYNLLERIGEGALGEVYRARDTKVGRTVALKLVRDATFTDAASRASFLDDARAAAMLSHPNIATLFDVGEYDEGCYLAYEFASGVTLRQDIEGGAVNPRRALELAVQIADALAEAHGHGVLHGDLRPDTIVVTQKGSAKVLEFGLSRWSHGGQTRVRAASAPESLGADAVRVVSYMSPEQALGGAVDPRTDVFSLGVILHEMLTGRNPFAAATVSETLLNVVSAAASSPPALASSSPDIDAIRARAMAKEIDKRHQSAASLSAELRSVGAMLDVRAGDASRDYVIPLDDESSAAGWWVVSLIVLAVAGVAWWYWSGT
jgi:serine/threonine-protein kinase